MVLEATQKGLIGWEKIPPDARPVQYPKPPYRVVIAAGGVANIVDQTIPLGMNAIYSTVEATVDEPLGLPLMVWRFLRNEIPLDETGDNFTLNHPLPAIIASDVRLLEGFRFRVQATNTGVVPYTAVCRVRGWIWPTRGDDKATVEKFQRQYG
jgi:hypothetical protein